MTIAEMRQAITAATGAKTATRLYPDGLAIGVQVYPDLNYAVWSLVPVDDESRAPYVDAIIASWFESITAPAPAQEPTP